MYLAFDCNLDIFFTVSILRQRITISSPVAILAIAVVETKGHPGQETEKKCGKLHASVMDNGQEESKTVNLSVWCAGQSHWASHRENLKEMKKIKVYGYCNLADIDGDPQPCLFVPKLCKFTTGY